MNDERSRGDERPLAWSQVPEGEPSVTRRPVGNRQGPPRPQPPRQARPQQPPQPPRGQQPFRPQAPQPRPTRVERPQPAPPQGNWAPPQTPEPIPARAERRSRGTGRVGERGSSVGARGSSGRVPPPPRPPRDRSRRRAAPEAPKPSATPRVTRKRRLHPLRWISLFLVLVIVGTAAATFYFDGKLNRVDSLAAYAGRIADTPGTNWLLVGSDAREGLSPQQQKDLATGGDLGGARTDTIMLVHIPKSGSPLLISIPRDLYVPVPGQGSYKINAAYFLGGPKLLVQTFESKAKVRIDHYAEIGFGGFANMVDALGGIEMCPKYPINDPKAGIRLQAGCQTLNGAQALGYVRTRATPNADLDRVTHQREFMTALFKKATSPSTLLNPFEMWSLADATVGALTVDTDTHLWDLGRLAWALSSSPVTTTTPTGGSSNTDEGDALLWGKNTTEFFGLIAADQPVPDRLLSAPANSG